jgi:hypothetical protein
MIGLAGFSLALLVFMGRSLAAPPATEPSSAATQPSNGAELFGYKIQYMGSTANTLFAPRTEEEYFSPFDIMNPSHIRPEMPLEIGHYEDLSLDMSLQTVGRLQAITQHSVVSGGVSQENLNPGFQDPFANLSFLATVPGKMDVYFDLYVASRPHPNTMYAHEGYLLFRDLPEPFDTGVWHDTFQYINLKAGAFDIDYGDGNYTRSNNAFVQRNPLVGNPLVDPNVEEIGAEVYSIKGPVYWLAGMTNGTTTEHFDYGTEPAFHGKLWGYPLPELRTSVSAYHAYLAGSGATNENSDLYAAGRSGQPFAAVFGGGDDPGSIQPQAGQDVTAFQGDATWLHWPFEIYGNVGWTQDTNINGPTPGDPAERWSYGCIQPVYHLTPSLYLAARYSMAVAESVGGVKTNGWVDRAEVGVGYWMTNDILLKLEGVYEQYNNFGANTGTVDGVLAGRDPNFVGGIMEISWSL